MKYAYIDSTINNYIYSSHLVFAIQRAKRVYLYHQLVTNIDGRSHMKHTHKHIQTNYNLLLELPSNTINLENHCIRMNSVYAGYNEQYKYI